jgi:Tfp pilus assembly protein PilO
MASLEDLNPRQQLIVFIVLGLALLGAAEYAWLNTLSQANAALRQKVTLLASSNAKLQPLALAAPELARSNQFLRTRLVQLETVVPAKPNIGRLLRMLERQARAARVAIRQVQAEPARSHQFFVSVPFHVMLQGGYAQIAAFYLRLAGLPRIFNVRKITLVRVSQSPLPAAPLQTVQADCEITTFYSHSGVQPAPGGKQ